MRVLLLGPASPVLEGCIAACGDAVLRLEDPLRIDDPVLVGVHFLVSYRYRHMISPAVLAVCPGRAVNLHIGMLPWNRGADPNLWSFLEDTPKGVTIHAIDEGLDTGPILAQREIPVHHDDTLRTSYDRLLSAIEGLFCEIWPELRVGSLPARPQTGDGSIHRSADKEPYTSLLGRGWDTPVASLVGKALRET